MKQLPDSDTELTNNIPSYFITHFGICSLYHLLMVEEAFGGGVVVVVVA
jgi:hypothetical protein